MMIMMMMYQVMLTIQSVGNFPISPSVCPTSPLVTANALPVFCTFQLRVDTMDKGAKAEAYNDKFDVQKYSIYIFDSVCTPECPL